MAYYVPPVWKSGGDTSPVSPTKLRPCSRLVANSRYKKRIANIPSMCAKRCTISPLTHKLMLTYAKIWVTQIPGKPYITRSVKHLDQPIFTQRLLTWDPLVSAVSAQLWVLPKMLTRAPQWWFIKKSFRCYATSRGRMAFKTKYSNCRHNFGRTRPGARFWGLGGKYIFMGEGF